MPFFKDILIYLYGTYPDGCLKFIHLAGVTDTVKGKADILATFPPEPFGTPGNSIGVHDAALAGAVSAVGAE